MEQARAIEKESGRHNIGFPRTGDSPILPLRILLPEIASGFRFARTETGVTFEEFRSPTYLSQTHNSARMDLMARGSFVVDPDTGRVLAADLSAEGPPPSSVALEFSVRYREDPELELLVPIALRERIRRVDKPTDDRLEVDIVYSNFRRFQVNVDEQVALPK
jgi:hypothetical protein